MFSFVLQMIYVYNLDDILVCVTELKLVLRFILKYFQINMDFFFERSTITAVYVYTRILILYTITFFIFLHLMISRMI